MQIKESNFSKEKLNSLIIPGISLFVGLAGIINIASAIFIHMPDRLRLLSSYIPLEIQLSTRAFTALAGLFLIYLSSNILKRKYYAWVFTIITLSISSLLHIVKGLDYEEAAILFGLILILLYHRNRFTRASRPLAMKNGLRLFLYSLGALLLYGTLGFTWLHYHYGRVLKTRDSFLDTVNIILFGVIQNRTASFEAQWFVLSLQLLSVFIILMFVYLALRPLFPDERTNYKDKLIVRDLLGKYGNTSISYYVLGKDKKFFFNQDKSVVIAYGRYKNFAMTCGDPLGAPEKIEEVLTQFIEYCRSNDWNFAIYQGNEEYVDIYTKLKLKRILIGKDAVINLNEFSLEGSHRKDIRTYKNKAEKEGWKIIDTQNLNDPVLIEQCEFLSHEWSENKFGGEMAFTMGISSIRGDGSTRTIILTDQNNEVLAFTTWIPIPAEHGWSLDLMRKKEGVNGVMEYLIAASLLQFKADGSHLASLGVVLKTIDEIEGVHQRQQIEKAVSGVLKALNYFYNYNGLWNFKQKFLPEWKKKYLIVENTSKLPLALYVQLKLHMPGLNISYTLKNITAKLLNDK